MEFNRRLRNAGVSLINPHRVVLECNRCGWRWCLPAKGRGRLPKGYWKCPNGCNSEDIPRIGYRLTPGQERDKHGKGGDLRWR